MTLVAVGRDTCPTCGAAVDTERSEQLPLLRHGGYGGARSTVRLRCSAGCGWWLDWFVGEHRASVGGR